MGEHGRATKQRPRSSTTSLRSTATVQSLGGEVNAAAAAVCLAKCHRHIRMYTRCSHCIHTRLPTTMPQTCNKQLKLHKLHTDARMTSLTGQPQDTSSKHGTLAQLPYVACSPRHDSTCMLMIWVRTHPIKPACDGRCDQSSSMWVLATAPREEHGRLYIHTDHTCPCPDHTYTQTIHIPLQA